MDAQKQVDKNYKAFKKMLPSLMLRYRGKFALMRNSEITEVYDTAHDAYCVGIKLYGNGKFSIQEVTDTPVFIFAHLVGENMSSCRSRDLPML